MDRYCKLVSPGDYNEDIHPNGYGFRIALDSESPMGLDPFNPSCNHVWHQAQIISKYPLSTMPLFLFEIIHTHFQPIAIWVDVFVIIPRRYQFAVSVHFVYHSFLPQVVASSVHGHLARQRGSARNTQNGLLASTHHRVRSPTPQRRKSPIGLASRA